MSELDDLRTPAFLVDIEKVERNATLMREKALRSAVLFRPHVKTHKTVEGALLQHGGSRGPITVSTLAEAEFFADAGFDDITYAVPVAPAKLARCESIARRTRRFGILFGHRMTLESIISCSKSSGWIFDVWMKIDCGYGRAGAGPDSEDSLDLARRAHAAPQVRLRGVVTHAGHSYHAASRDEIGAIARQESDAVSRFALAAGAAGVAPLVRSVGSTPTASVVDAFENCDEVRPGNYVFYDALQAAVGSCSLAEVAASVLATIVGVYPERNELIVDAGALALSKDRGADHLSGDTGFGVVCALDGRPLPMRLGSLSQEHGKIGVDRDLDWRTVAPGSRLRIVPNHSCLTAAMFDRYYVMRADRIVSEWTPVRGW